MTQPDTNYVGDSDPMDLVLTPEQEATLWEGHRQHEIENWRKALVLLFTKTLDNECPWYWRLGCIAAMLFGRKQSSRDKSYDYIELGYFDYARLYAGWEATLICFNPKTIRYCIEKDGDWTM